jgi:hypothetical protein
MATVEYSPDGWHDSGLDVVHYFEMYTYATTPLEQAQYLTELHNSMSDLKTYLPGYDEKTGMVVDPRD